MEFSHSSRLVVGVVPILRGSSMLLSEIGGISRRERSERTRHIFPIAASKNAEVREVGGEVLDVWLDKDPWEGGGFASSREAENAHLPATLADRRTTHDR